MQHPRVIPAARIFRDGESASPRRFAARLTAGAAGLALALAFALPAPAKADSDDLAKALVAALVVGAIVHGAKKDDPAPAPVRDTRRREPHVGSRLPSVCAIEIEGGRRSVELYSENCLRGEGVRARLPRHCASGARIFGKRDRVYGADCLRDEGFLTRGR